MNNRRIAFFTLKALAITLSLIVLIFVIGIFSLPSLLSKQLPPIIEQKIGRKAAITDLNLDLYSYAVKIKSFALHEKNGALFLAFDELAVEFDLQKSFKESAVIIKQISLKKPEIHLSRQANGTFNFQDLTHSDPEAKSDNASNLPLIIEKLSITDGKIVWNDAQTMTPWAETLENVGVEVEQFSTNSSKPANIKLNVALQSGGNLALHSTIAMNPIKLQGHLASDHLNLAKFITTFAPKLDLKINNNNSFSSDYEAIYDGGKFAFTLPNAVVELHEINYKHPERILKLADFKYETALSMTFSGNNWELDAKTAKIFVSDLNVQDQLQGKLKELTFDAAYQLNSNEKGLEFKANKGNLLAKDLEIVDQAQQLISVNSLNVKGLQINPNKHELQADTVLVSQANVKTWLDTDGSLNFEHLFPKDRQIEAEPKIVTKTNAWTISVANIGLENSAVNFEDKTLSKPIVLTLNPINFKLRDYTNLSNTHLPFEFSAGVNKNGLVGFKGEATLSPFSTKMAVNVKDIDLEKFQPYYDRIILLDIIDGMLNIDGNLLLKLSDQQPPDIQFVGNTDINDLLIRDQRVHKDFLKWERMALKNIAVDLLSQRYTANELIINKPYARVTIRKDKTVNFSNLLIAKEDKKAIPTTVKPTENKSAYFKLGKIQIIEGSSDFTDLSLFLPFAAHIKSLDGGASGVSSDKNCQIQVNLKGNAYDLAPVDITGQISPYLGEYDTKINFNGLPMPLVSSYMVQFVGYKVEKGKMTLNLHYQIANKKLSASNHFLVDQFELGEHIDHPDAVSLPIKLAVALLKDGNGKIKIDVPISGDLDNPTFNLRTIVTDALFNAFSKVISSPFSALASLTGGEEGELSQIRFSAGNATLEKTEKTKLDGIAKALRERSQLMLNIKGITLEVKDWPAISDDALYDQLKIRRAAEINQKTVRKIRAEYVELSKEDYERLLAEMFIEKFPLLAEKSMFGTPILKNAKPGEQFYEVAKQKLQNIIQPEQERLKELANDRAQAIAKYLVQQTDIPQERVFILDSKVDPNKDAKEIASLLTLKVN